MSEMVNIYLSYLRRGLGARTLTDTSGKRPFVNVRMRVVAERFSDKQERGDRQLEQSVHLYGPGDVLGFEADKTILRARPVTEEAHFNANFIPFVEFADPDFLWRYSGHKEGKYWQPWLSLIVLKAPGPDGQGGEFSYEKARKPGLPSCIRLYPEAVLPDLSQAWRWAHVQLSAPQKLVEQPDQLPSYLERHPQDAVCRLLAPRRLEPATRYAAFIVPTYRLGLEAALDLDIPQTTLKDYSWGAQNPEILPWYHHWEFRTGERGDFEDLLRRITFRKLEGVGKRKVQLDNPGYGLNHWQGQEVYMEGALRSTDGKYDALGMDHYQYPQAADHDMADLLNRGESLEGEEQELRVVPPMYGRWFMAGPEAEVKIQPHTNRQIWFHQLNLDPRHRIAAGLGAQYVREHQEELMEAAWKQLEEIRELNRELNRMQFGARVSDCLHKRISLPKPKEEDVSVMPVFAESAEDADGADSQTNLLLIAAPISEKLVVEESSGRKGKFPSQTLAAKLRMRDIPQTLLANKARKYYQHRVPERSQARILKKTVPASVVPPELQPEGLVGKKEGNQVQVHLPPSDQEAVLVSLGEKTSDSLSPHKTIVGRMAERMAGVRAWEQRQKQKQGVSGVQVTSFAAPPAEDPLRPVMAHPEFHAPMYAYLLELSREFLAPGMEDLPENTLTFLATNPRFIKSFMLGLNHEFAAELRWREFPTDMRGSYFRKFWDATIYAVSAQEKADFRDSEAGRAFLQRLEDLGRGRPGWTEIEDAYFKLSDPELGRMYEEALEEWLLTLDQHKDIRPIQEWPLNQRLESGARGGQDQDLVMLIRADLLKVYPSTHIFLAPRKTDGRPDLAHKKMPIFEGNLPPDIYLLGFDISRKEAASGNYFLIFEERFSQENYGLDVEGPDEYQSPDDLAWSHFPTVKVGDYINHHQPSVATNWDAPANIARHFRQKQVRVAIDMNYFF